MSNWNCGWSQNLHTLSAKICRWITEILTLLCPSFSSELKVGRSVQNIGSPGDPVALWFKPANTPQTFCAEHTTKVAETISKLMGNKKSRCCQQRSEQTDGRAQLFAFCVKAEPTEQIMCPTFPLFRFLCNQSSEMSRKRAPVVIVFFLCPTANGKMFCFRKS